MVVIGSLLSKEQETWTGAILAWPACEAIPYQCRLSLSIGISWAAQLPPSELNCMSLETLEKHTDHHYCHRHYLIGWRHIIPPQHFIFRWPSTNKKRRQCHARCSRQPYWLHGRLGTRRGKDVMMSLIPLSDDKSSPPLSLLRGSRGGWTKRVEEGSKLRLPWKSSTRVVPWDRSIRLLQLLKAKTLWSALEKSTFMMMMMESYFVCVDVELLWRCVDGRSKICDICEKEALCNIMGLVMISHGSTRRYHVLSHLQKCD